MKDRRRGGAATDRLSAVPEVPARTIVLAWLPAVLTMALIWALSSVTAPVSLEDFPLRDKGAHFLEYGLLGLLVAHAVRRTWPRHHAARTLTLAVVITVLWGLLDEIHQAFVPGRSSDALDLVADGAGAIAGALARHAGQLTRRRLARDEPARETASIAERRS